MGQVEIEKERERERGLLEIVAFSDGRDRLSCRIVIYGDGSIARHHVYKCRTLIFGSL